MKSYAVLLADNEELKKENEKLKQKIEELKKENEELKRENDNDDYEEENEDYKEENENLKKENEKLKQKIDKAYKAFVIISRVVNDAYEEREHRDHEENIKSVKCFINYIDKDFREDKQTQLYVFTADTKTEHYCKIFENIKELYEYEENYKESSRTIAIINVSLIDVVSSFVVLETYNDGYLFSIYDILQFFTTDNNFTSLEISKMIIEKFLDRYDDHYDIGGK